ncbi:MAG: type II toxin-antitoxin system PemK/MazF family toxin [Bacteroidota bacterium]
MSYQQGDIILVPFPYSDQTDTSVRPAIVISNDEVNRTEDVILAQITTKDRKDTFSFDLPNDAIITPWLPPYHISYVRCHKIATTNKNLIHKKISEIKRDRLGVLLDKIQSFIR